MLEQQIQHRQSEAQAKQKQLDTLSEAIEARTLTLLESQQERLTAAAVPLKASLEELKSQIKTQKGLISANVEIISRQMADIEAQNVTLAAAQVAVAETSKKLVNALARMEDVKATITKMGAQKQQLESDTADLVAHATQLTATIDELIIQQTALEGKLATLDEVYRTKQAEKERIIAMLDVKIIEFTQNLDAMRADEQRTREDLAVWQRSLESQDQNLRIREMKVEQGEGRLVSNSTLLNL